ncbi:hypothetical protein PGB90_003758 [Kerria lacca]
MVFSAKSIYFIQNSLLLLQYSFLHGPKACRTSVLARWSVWPPVFRCKPFEWPLRLHNAFLSSANAFFRKGKSHTVPY